MFLDVKELAIFSTGLDLKQACKISSHSSNSNDIIRNLAKLSPKYESRFKLFLRYHDLVKSGKLTDPIILLIIGGHATGKTSVTAELAFRIGLRNILGADAIRECLRSVVSEKKYPLFFSSVYECWRIKYRKPTKGNIIEAYEEHSECIASAIDRLLERCLRDGESIAIESLYLTQKLCGSIAFQNKSVIPIALEIRDPNVHRKRLLLRKSSTHIRRDAERFIPVFNEIRVIHNHLVNLAQKNDIPIISNDDFDKAIDECLEIVFNRVKALVEKAEKIVECEN
jgi:2-phosphoglycerate kinase